MEIVRRARHVLGGVAVLLLAAPASAVAEVIATAPPPASAAARPLILGGTRVSIADAPWQVRLRISSGSGYLTCGGVILDAARVATAAHCVQSGTTTRSPDTIDVFAGASSFRLSGGGRARPTPAGDNPQRVAVSAVAVHPGFRGPAGASGSVADFRDDVALLTLRDLLRLDGVTAVPVTLPTTGAAPPVGTPVTVTGFGAVGADGPDGYLNRLSAQTVDVAGIAPGFDALFVATTALGGAPCEGDSGSPLVAGTTLVGLVTTGGSCAAGDMTTYTNVAAGEIAAFLQGSSTPPQAPTGGLDVSLAADQRGALPLRPGRVVTCLAGTWAAAPSFSYTFFEATGAVIQNGPSASYRIGSGDLERRIGCRATAITAGGVGHTPATTTAPPVQPALRATPRVVVRSRPAQIRRGRTARITITIANRGKAAATRVATCVTVPRQMQVVARGGGRLRKRTLCYTTAKVTPGHPRALRLRVRVSPRTTATRLRLTARTTMAGARGSGRRTVAIRRR